jgi:hypothetical protein
VSIGVTGLFLQIAFVYWFAIIHKSGREWREDGTALYYALSSDQLISPTGAYLLNFPELLKVLSFGTLAVETFAPILLFSPFLKGPPRTSGVALIMGLHFGILVAMSIGYFPLLSAFCMVCFLPAWFWDTAVPRLRAAMTDAPRAKRFIDSLVALSERVRTAPVWDRIASMRRSDLSLMPVGGASAPFAGPAEPRYAQPEDNPGNTYLQWPRTACTWCARHLPPMSWPPFFSSTSSS